MLARVSMGAFAAIASCDQVSSRLFRIASPSLTKSPSEVLVRWRKPSALASARGRRSSGLARSSRSMTVVRITRCGAPSMLWVTTVSVSVAFRYAALMWSGTVLSLVRRKRVPIAMPAAP